jgi:hypothetical protein
MAHGGPAGELAYVVGRHLPAGGHLRRHLLPTDRAATSFRLALPQRGTTEQGRGAGAGAGAGSRR